MVTSPGVLIKVHVPVEGKPFKTTLPVAKEQVGCVIDSTVGAPGIAGGTLMVILADEAELQPVALVTV